MKAIDQGVGEELEFATLTTQNIIDKLEAVLENPKYSENAAQLSARFQDQKETPIERAVWWAEWLIRNPNCDYLKSPVLKLGFIGGNSYDVIAVISIAIFVILWIVVKSVLSLFKLFFGATELKSTYSKGKIHQKKSN